MPLLDDAKNCFVGQTQIKQIYAGTQLVWGGIANLSQINFTYSVLGGNKSSCFVAFKDIYKSGSCDSVAQRYQKRSKYPFNDYWQGWTPITSCFLGGSSGGWMVYAATVSYADASYDGSLIEIKDMSLNKSEQITIYTLGTPLSPTPITTLKCGLG